MHAIAALRRTCLFLLIACALSACPRHEPRPGVAGPVAGSVPAPSAGAVPMVLPDFTRLVEAQGPAVVNVVTARRLAAPDAVGPMPGDPFFEFFRRFIPDLPPPGSPGPELQGLGSGFIISADGLILTNAHVVADASKLTVRLADGKREFPGKVLGADSRSDVALIKIDATDLPVAKLGNSTTVKPGQWAAAIGSPFGFRNTITIGVVSATNRDLPNESMVPFIQTDVAVNPGNSGGPLLNVAGEVIGINSMIYSGTGGYMGVSFAIPIEVALDVAKQLQTSGKVTRGRLGVAIQPVSAEIAQVFRVPAPSGALVASVEPGGPADKAGLKSGDVILEYNGKPIAETAELPRLVAASKPGSQASLVIWRNGARQALTVTVGELASEPAARIQQSAPAQTSNRLGLVLREVPPALRHKLGIEAGLLVEGVTGPAAETPVRPGDVIVAVNQQAVSSVAEFNRLIAREKPGDPVALLVRRGDAATYVIVRVPSANPS